MSNHSINGIHSYITPLKKLGKCNDFAAKLNQCAKCFTPFVNNISTTRLNPLTKPFFTSKSSFISSTFLNFFFVLSSFVFILVISIYYAIFDIKTNDLQDETPHHTLQKLRLRNVDKIIIGHLNINSIRNKFDILADIIGKNIDILLISESKIDASFPNSQFKLPGFSDPFRLDRTVNGGGLLLYTRSDLPVRPLPLISDKIECLMIELNISNKKWLLAGVYNPQKSRIVSFLESLERNLSFYLSSYEHFILFGDFNCEMGENAMLDFCCSFSLNSLIKSPTCFKSLESPTCIDLILTNRPHNFQNSITLETGLSDFHLLTVSVLKSSFRKKPAKVIKYRNYKNYSYLNFRSHVDSVLDTIELSSISNDRFVQLITEILNLHAPIRTKYIRANDQPFMTKDLSKEHMKRTRLLNKFRKSKTTENKVNYKKQRNLCTNLLKRVKTSYFERLNPSKISDNKNFWKNVKPLFSGKSASSDCISLIEDNKIVSSDHQIAEIFNLHFSNAVKNLDISFEYHDSLLYDVNSDNVLAAINKYEKHPSILKIKDSYDQSSKFSFSETNLSTVVKEIGNLKDSKASPIDSIPVRILKDHYDIFGPKIVNDFNICIKTGDFPLNMKLADVSPIFKKDDKLLKENYRPVSILSPLSKIFERLILYQINSFMREKLSIYLCGFRKGMSTQNCLLYLVEKWKKSIDKNGKSGVLLTDLSKAFDCLVHDLLIAKLHAYGFDISSLRLLLNYLTNRLQRVKINSNISSWRDIETGVPQGSILGPELFNFNSNDLFLFMTLDVANFADDNSPFTTADSTSNILSKLSFESRILLSWIRNNGLKANPEKFHLLVSDQNENLNIIIEENEIKNSKSQKLLGVTIDNKMSFENHVSNLCTKASQKLHALSRVSKFMTFNQRKIIMETFFLSHFGYCPLVWMFHSRTLNNRINRLHKRALQIVFNNYESSYDELLNISGSFKIHERNIQTLAIELYKVVNNLAPKIMHFVFQTKTNLNYPRENTFKTSNVRTVSWGTESLSFLGPKIWSIIPSELKKLPFSQFKSKIRSWKPESCPCRLCKIYEPSVGFLKIS